MVENANIRSGNPISRNAALYYDQELKRIPAELKTPIYS
jgi:hypothetical protein